MTSHVPPPDPMNLWPFNAGESRVVGLFGDKMLTFFVTAVHADYIEGQQFLGDLRLTGQLHIDKPVVMVRDHLTGEPVLTMTLRAIKESTALIQVTGHPKGSQAPRSNAVQ